MTPSLMQLLLQQSMSRKHRVAVPLAPDGVQQKLPELPTRVPQIIEPPMLFLVQHPRNGVVTVAEHALPAAMQL